MTEILLAVIPAPQHLTYLPGRCAGPLVGMIDSSISGDEAYTIIDSHAFAKTPAGLFYAQQTFDQLDGRCAHIEDAPRYAWRGSHLDVARHFMPKATVLRHLERMAKHKLNVFHWHLTDDQGWRIEIKAYPRLTEGGPFYTRDDVREIVAFAEARFITVIPEIEMPGHARAALAAYPYLGNDPTRWWPLPGSWGVFEEVFGLAAVPVLQEILAEVIPLFPGRMVHIGGDEVPKKEWRETAAAKRIGVADEDAVQAWFVAQMHGWLGRAGKRLIGWDEILDGGAPFDAAIMCWRKRDKCFEALAAGHEVVLAHVDPLYLNKARNGVEAIFGFQPIDHPRVLGGQAQLWTEYMLTPASMEQWAWPRLCAVSEILWTDERDLAGFQQRLAEGDCK